MQVVHLIPYVKFSVNFSCFLCYNNMLRTWLQYNFTVARIYQESYQKYPRTYLLSGTVTLYIIITNDFRSDSHVLSRRKATVGY